MPDVQGRRGQAGSRSTLTPIAMAAQRLGGRLSKRCFCSGVDVVN